jgi:hypothetical protein
MEISGKGMPERLTGRVILASSILPQVYVHHEREVGNCRCHDNKRNSGIFTSTYFKFYDPSAPKEEWDDQNRPYSISYPWLAVSRPKLQPALASILAELQTKQNPSQRQYSEPPLSSFAISSIFGRCNRSCRNSLEECLLVATCTHWLPDLSRQVAKV